MQTNSQLFGQMKPQIVAATGFFELLKSEPDLRSLGLETMRRINRLTEDFMSLTKIESYTGRPKPYKPIRSLFRYNPH